MQQEPHWRHEKTMILCTILEGSGKKTIICPANKKTR